MKELIELLPSDPSSFMWGVVVALVTAYFLSIFRAAGSDTWRWIKQHTGPKDVGRKFEPTLYDRGVCVWAREHTLAEKGADGFTYYPYSRWRRKCFRQIYDEAQRGLIKEFLMVAPGAPLVNR